jgi:hypothetical protein
MPTFRGTGSGVFAWPGASGLIAAHRLVPGAARPQQSPGVSLVGFDGEATGAGTRRVVPARTISRASPRHAARRFRWITTDLIN